MNAGPSARIEDAPTGAGKRIRVSAVVNETCRKVLAERVQRADTFLSRLVGLLGRDGLGEGEALWIFPCKGIHTMGMSFSIDAIFLDEGLRVVAVRHRVRPWRATGFIKGATSVLELPAGSILMNGVAVGDQMGFVPSVDDARMARADGDGREDVA